LLDTASAPAPGTARPERAARSRASEQPRATGDRNEPRAESRPADGSATQTEAATGTTTKPADIPNTQQAKSGQSPDTSEPVAKSAETVAETASIPVADFAAIAEALNTEPAGDASPLEASADMATPTPQQPTRRDPGGTACGSGAARNKRRTCCACGPRNRRRGALQAADVCRYRTRRTGRTRHTDCEIRSAR
jgi:hypothetical protein